MGSPSPERQKKSPASAGKNSAYGPSAGFKRGKPLSHAAAWKAAAWKMRFPNCPSGRATKTVARLRESAESLFGCFVTDQGVSKGVILEKQNGRDERPFG
jgi:hypothetical protein